MRLTTLHARSAATLTLAMLVPVAAALAQDDTGGKFASWAKVDASDQRKAYVDAMREAKPDAFSAAIRSFAVDTVLPQLQLEANRGTIEVVRRKIRALLLDNVGDPKAFEAASRAVLEFMAPLARDAKADPLVRINALLLIGELRSKDNKLLPWAGSLDELTSAAGDGGLPASLRVAALAGLAQHVDAAQKKGTATAAALGKTLGPVLVPIVASPPAGDPAAVDWMVSRALDMVPEVIPELGAEAAAAVEKVLVDPSRSPDVRVRAAAALGRSARPASGIKASRAVEAIRGLAIAALEADLQMAERHGGERSGVRIGPGQPADGGENPAAAAGLHVPEAVGRRAAWRLAVLAKAIGAEEGKGGLIELLPANERVAARDLATDLAVASPQLDTPAPLEQTIRDVLARMRNPTAEAEPVTDSEAPAGEAGAPDK